MLQQMLQPTPPLTKATSNPPLEQKLRRVLRTSAELHDELDQDSSTDLTLPMLSAGDAGDGSKNHKSEAEEL